MDHFYLFLYWFDLFFYHLCESIEGLLVQGDRLRSVIFTGLSSRLFSESVDVMKEVKGIVQMLEISKFGVKNYPIIPWSSSYSMKRTFYHASTCGLTLRYSYKLGKRTKKE